MTYTAWVSLAVIVGCVCAAVIAIVIRGKFTIIEVEIPNPAKPDSPLKLKLSHKDVKKVIQILVPPLSAPELTALKEFNRRPSETDTVGQPALDVLKTIDQTVLSSLADKKLVRFDAPQSGDSDNPRLAYVGWKLLQATGEPLAANPIDWGDTQK